MKIALFIAFLIIGAVANTLLQSSKRRVAIKNPRLGFLDLTEGASDQIVTEDTSALGGIFGSVKMSKDNVPECDVLFLYAKLGDGGSLQNTGRNLRDTIRDSGAKVVVVASENPNSPLPHGRPKYGHANLVITLDRKGQLFSSFFQALFEKMGKGTAMPLAWIKLAPQNPNNEHVDCPETVFLCEVGAVSFK